jgi:hypothetical protein
VGELVREHARQLLQVAGPHQAARDRDRGVFWVVSGLKVFGRSVSSMKTLGHGQVADSIFFDPQMEHIGNC